MSLKVTRHLYAAFRKSRGRHGNRTIIGENGRECFACSRRFHYQIASRYWHTRISARYFSTSSRLCEVKASVDQKERSKSSIDHEEIDKFSRIAKSWWDVMGEFRALHNMNELRVPLIRDAIADRASASGMPHGGTRPLKGIKILDVGCGGGILSEPLARLGAQVTGIDASAENITMAGWHANLDKHLSGHLQYICCPVEQLPTDEKYDAVVASEIVEHVSNPEHFIASCCNLVKPKGSIFITTLNKTWLSYALGIVAAERILRIVPAGAHDWDKFVPPSTLKSWLSHNGFRTVLVHGMALNPLSQRWSWTRNTSINYALHAVNSKTTS